MAANISFQTTFTVKANHPPQLLPAVEKFAIRGLYETY
ncbi:hypothetical protein MCC93_24810 [Morococcus cerebrosus]|uniref:Uncharacterized protein n=1 Tax=Morococcus cerebrosus TaxID=1056807 RepID=A0A0C1GHF9_9NEIS|nr:hypothetical protein MCC93_24810 [Morococcus cerebrosus]